MKSASTASDPAQPLPPLHRSIHGESVPTGPSRRTTYGGDYHTLVVEQIHRIPSRATGDAISFKASRG